MPDERIKDLAVHATEFASDDYIVLDGTTNGTRNMTAANLLELTAENTLAGNLAPAYDNATGAVAGHLYMHEGKSWVCKENTSDDFDSSKFYELPVANVLPSKSVDEILTAESWIDGYGVVAFSEQSFCPLGELWASQTQSATGYISLPSILDGKLSFLECVLAVQSLFGLCFYDSNKNVICAVPHPNQDYYGTKHRIVEIPVNAAFVRFSCTTTEKANFFAKVTSKIKIDVDGLDEKIDNQYKLIDIGSDVSFTDGKFVVAISAAGTVGSLKPSEYQSASDYIKIPTITNGILQYMNGVVTSSNIASGLVFYDADYTAISGVLEFHGSSHGVKENVVEIPNGAVYFRCTIPTAYKTEFFAHMMTRLYSDAKESQKDIEILNVMAGGELSPYSESLTIGDWTSDKFYRATSALIGTIGNSTYQSIIRVDLPDGLKRKLTYTRAKVTSAASSLAAGLVFFDKDGSAISGILHIADSSELSYEEYTTDVPRDATSVGFTMPTALLSVFAASINGTAVTYDNELGREVNELKK